MLHIFLFQCTNATIVQVCCSISSSPTSLCVVYVEKNMLCVIFDNSDIYLSSIKALGTQDICPVLWSYLYQLNFSTVALINTYSILFHYFLNKTESEMVAIRATASVSNAVWPQVSHGQCRICDWKLQRLSIAMETSFQKKKRCCPNVKSSYHLMRAEVSKSESHIAWAALMRWHERLYPLKQDSRLQPNKPEIEPVLFVIL